MTRKVSGLTTAALGLALSFLLAGITIAAEAQTGILVTGNGEAKGKPTSIEIGATISGDAELAADAIVKYRDSKKSAIKALEALKLPSLVIESSGYSITQGIDPQAQMMAMRGMAVQTGNNRQRVAVIEQMKIRLKDLDKLKDDTLMETVLKVLDTARDAGLTVGPKQMSPYYQPQVQAPSIVTFKIQDISELREQAYKLAMDDARAKAERLAKLSNVKLGRVVTVQDNNNQRPAQPQVVYYGMVQTGEDELASGSFSEITMKVVLNVQFEIEK